MNAPIIILVRPQMGENIGAVARAMSNFGLKELRLAAPRDGWPNPKATEMAAGAEYIIESAQVYPDFQAAMADVQLVYATTARSRYMEKKVVIPSEAVSDMRAQLSGGRKVALVFGPERSGLENEEVAQCDTLITIPTAPENQSLNIAQSMVILGYEWWGQQSQQTVLRDLPEMAPREELQGLFDQLEQYLDAADYFRVDHKKPSMLQNIKNMLQRGQFSSQEVRTFRGMLRALWERRLVR